MDTPPSPSQAEPERQRHGALRYFLIGFALWVFVDIGTAGGFRLSYLRTYGPTLLIFYVGCPAAMAYLIFRRRWSGKALFAAMVAQIAIVEGLFTHNPLVITFPLALAGIPLAVCVYAPLTYFPLWLVRGEMRAHRGTVWSLSAVVAVVMLLTTFGKK